MKLYQLYSSDSRFHSIRFNESLNLVLGKVTRHSDMNLDSHNLGKSTLIDLLDFMMLKNVDSKHPFKKYTEFSNCIFYLEILLNSGRYLTIRRAISEPTKISFKVNEQSTQCSELTIWDKEGLAIAKAIVFLNDQLEFDVLERWDYRKTISFFLRTQKDYSSVFQLGKFMNGKHRDWKPVVFDLLGYDSENLSTKYDLDQQLEELCKKKKHISEEMSVQGDDYDRIKSALCLKTEERDDMQKQVDAFNFYTEERNLNRSLVEEIEAKIAELNTREYTISYELEKMKTSIENVPTFDMEQLKELYGEVEIYFQDAMVHSYEDLLEFSKQVTLERNKYLKLQIKQAEEELITIRESLLRLDTDRNAILSALQDKDSFHKFKEYQKKLAAVEGEVMKLNLQLKNIDTISGIAEKEDELKQQIVEISKNISRQVKSQDGDVPATIKRCYNEIFRKIFGVSALLYMKTNSSGNVEFEAEVAPDENAEATGEGNGNTYNKMLCVAFDLAVLAAYSGDSFFRFVYHDGVLEGLDNRKKELFMSVVRDYCHRYQIQYIFSSIEDDIPSTIMQNFDSKEICVELTDECDSGKLFGFSF